ncbi:hypothetical protein [Candidatus Methanodesulfokora washburnensis]|nr:hypothetical protein [Candidatus Methanodesulfokores washburnensis]
MVMGLDGLDTLFQMGYDIILKRDPDFLRISVFKNGREVMMGIFKSEDRSSLENFIAFVKRMRP